MNYTPSNTIVFLLAAGRGERMRPLTDTTPKPLLKVGGRNLLEHHLIHLQMAGFKHIVINIAHLAEQIKTVIGDGSQFGLNIKYSDESNTGALETAGGIFNALDLIQSDPFLVINADIYTDFPFEQLLAPLNKSSLGRLVIINNPEHNPTGDFAISGSETSGKASALTLKGENKEQQTITFSGIGLYQKQFFTHLGKGSQALGPLLRAAISKNQLEHTHYQGQWFDIGTPERLAEINNRISQSHV